MIETADLDPAFEAADAMTRPPKSPLVSREFQWAVAIVTVMVEAKTGAVQPRVRAGADACERVA